MKMNRVLIFITSIFSVLFTANIFAANAETKVIISEKSIITGIKATATVTITGTDISTAIANNTPIETDVIANACMFTTHQDGDFDLTVTADKNFMNGKSFALYNATLGQVDTTLFVTSVNAPTPIELKPNTATPLQNHSDAQASGTNCANQVRFRLNISVANLRIAKAGTYDFAFTTTASDYTG